MTAARWVQQGRLFLWRYLESTRNYPGWHVTADAAGCTSVIALIDQIEAARGHSATTLRILPPTPSILAVPNNRRGRARWRSVAQLRLQPCAAPAWTASESADTLTITLAPPLLRDLRQGMVDIAAGEGDYNIGAEADAERLWFWWLPR